MVDTDTMPAPELKPLNPVTKFERERAAFERMKPDMLRHYRGQYVAIHDEKVVGAGPELKSVAFEAYGRFGYIPIYVDLVTDEPMRPIRIPSPRVISRG